MQWISLLTLLLLQKLMFPLVLLKQGSPELANYKYSENLKNILCELFHKLHKKFDDKVWNIENVFWNGL